MAKPKKITQAIITPREEAQATRDAVGYYGLKDFKMRRKRNPKIPLSDQIAHGSSFHYKNWVYPGGDKAFPYEPRLQRVDKYYPTTEWGPLLIDEPIYPFEVEECARKRKFMLEAGFRYLVIDAHTDLEDCYQQLGV